ncbi:MAG TPA: efflux RND transporter periplasmic adaptor subunit, partial [Pseudomonas sp.]|nr:efflux RND transporter periplasmic adaptor subunit [Pseudomonas sp.]
RQAQTALDQAKATYDFLLSSNRFSKSQTYDWLNSKFASFYFTAFNTAQSLCQAAEACWQYEMGNFSQFFVRPGVWNNSYRGLGAGEELKMSLQQMYREYVQNNKRELEIRKTISLKSLKAKDPASTINKTWEEIATALVSNGTCEFELTQKMLDDDYAGQNHYLRRIKTISVSLPAVLGPYEDTCSVLGQISSKVEMLPAVGTTRENLRVSQQIALSHGVDDNGLFQLNFQDERYLPFEYTGAISRWTLTFPNPQMQKAMLESLTDIIIHISYTARTSRGLQ